MKQYSVTIKGETPLLMHQDNISWCEMLKKWQLEPGNKSNTVAGDDRTPPFTWIGYMYFSFDEKHPALPSDNLMTMLREGGAKCLTGNGKQTYKALTQAGLVVDQAEWVLDDPRTGKPYDTAGIMDLVDEEDFATHEAWAKERGFELFSKRAAVGTSKHIRVRPRFDFWQASGSITVLDEKITKDVLQNILTFGGAKCGLCDWRPSSKRAPGSYGRFSVDVKKA